MASREVGSFWSQDAYVSDEEDAKRVSYNDRVIVETLGETIQDRLKDWREWRDEYRAERQARRKEKKEQRERKRLAKLEKQGKARENSSVKR